MPLVNEGSQSRLKIFCRARQRKKTGLESFLFLAGLPRATISRATAAKFAGRSRCRARQYKMIFIFLAGIACDNACAGRALSARNDCCLQADEPMLCTVGVSFPAR